MPVLAAGGRPLVEPPENTIADVAQLVAHNLAKVGVAGSNPVVRSVAVTVSGGSSVGTTLGGVAERRGNGLQSRVHGFKSRLHLDRLSTTRRVQLSKGA